MQSNDTIPRARRWTTPLVATLVAALAVPAAGAATIDIGVGAAPRRGQAQVPISLVGASGVAGITVDLLVPSSILRPPSCSLSAAVAGELETAVVTVAGTPPGMARLRVTMIGSASFPNGPILTCRFPVAPNAAFGTYPLSGVGLGMADEDGNSLAGVVDGGAVEVRPCTGCCP